MLSLNAAWPVGFSIFHAAASERRNYYGIFPIFPGLS